MALIAMRVVYIADMQFTGKDSNFSAMNGLTDVIENFDKLVNF